MRLAYGDGEGVIAGIDALPARELGRPRCEGRRIQGVAAQPNVEDDCVETNASRPIEQCDELALLLFGGESRTRGPIAVRCGTQPCTAKFTENDRRKNGA